MEKLEGSVYQKWLSIVKFITSYIHGPTLRVFLTDLKLWRKIFGVELRVLILRKLIHHLTKQREDNFRQI